MNAHRLDHENLLELGLLHLTYAAIVGVLLFSWTYTWLFANERAALLVREARQNADLGGDPSVEALNVIRTWNFSGQLNRPSADAIWCFSSRHGRIYRT